MANRARVLVAIDGPAGAGKSTVAKLVAEALGFLLVDTGAMYRAVAFGVVGAGLSLSDDDGVGRFAEDLAARRGIRLAVHRDGATHPPRVALDGRDVTSEIRTPEMSFAASRVSANPRVRAALLELQRHAGAEGGVVLEGRDIGTVVFPDAEVKFFLTASATERARRRYSELLDRGTDTSFEATLHDVEERDKADTERPIAPLKQAEDAILVDSGGRPIEDVVLSMVTLVREREAIHRSSRS